MALTEPTNPDAAIAALEAQRGVVPDDVLDAAIATLREQVAAEAAPRDVGQRRQVTVLFADVEGFTHLSEHLDPEDLTDLMNRVWTRIDGAIVGYGGTVDKHIGDAVMAVFGAPVAHEDDPERAVRAALDLHGALAEAVSDAPVDGGRLRVRVGVNTGLVLMDRIGSTTEYTAMGHTVNLASRLEHASRPGGVLISHDTFVHIRGAFDVEPVGPLELKGVTEPVDAYQVIREKPRRFHIPTRGVAGLETRMIGRDDELARLVEMAHQVDRTGSPASVTVIGEAGVGKSRLLSELATWLELQPDETWLFMARATDGSDTLPFSLMRDLLSFRFEIHLSDRSDKACRRLEAGMSEVMGEAGSDAAAVLGHLIGFDFTGHPALQGLDDDPAHLRERAVGALAGLFEKGHRGRRTVALFEDLHWADGASLSLMTETMEQLRIPLLAVATGRPDLLRRFTGWGDRLAGHVALYLEPLPAEGSGRLVGEILRKAPSIPPEVAGLIVARAEGNPFYLEELVKKLMEDGVIVVGEEAWDVRADLLDPAAIPTSLTGVLQARLDALSPPGRGLLEEASAYGRTFWDEPLVSPSRSKEAVTDLLDAALRRELVVERPSSAFVGTRELAFKHALLRDVTYESMPRRRRRVHHAAAAAWLEHRAGDRAGELAATIAEHHNLADNAEQAGDWWVRAGSAARRSFALDEAVGHFEAALSVAGGRFEIVAEALDGLGKARADQADYDSAVASFRRLVDAAADRSEPAAAANGWLGIASAMAQQGAYEGSVDAARRGEEQARAAGEGRVLAGLMMFEAWGLLRLGRVDEAEERAADLIAHSKQLGDDRALADAHNLLGALGHTQGNHDLARDHLREALGLYQRLGEPDRAMAILNNLGVIAESLGDFASARDRYADALAMSRELGNRDGEISFLSNLGVARLGLGDDAGAVADLERAIELASVSGAANLAEAYTSLALARLGLDMEVEARDAAIEGLRLAHRSGAPDLQAAAWRALGEVASTSGVAIAGLDGESSALDADGCFERSAALAGDIGSEGELARTLRAWARHARRQGQVEVAAGRWDEARDLFSRIGAVLEVERMQSDAEQKVAD